MKYEDIKKSLQRVSLLIEDCEHNTATALEYDIILNELRNIYTAIRFCQPQESVTEAETETFVAAASGETVAEPETVCDTIEEAAEPAMTESCTKVEGVEAVENLPETVEVTEQAAETIQKIEPETEPDSDEMRAFIKSDEETQNRRRMIVRSLYDDTDTAPFEIAAEPAVPEEQIEHPVEDDLQAQSNDIHAEPVLAAVSEPETEPVENMGETSETSEKSDEPENVENILTHIEEHHYTPDTSDHVLGEVINADVQTFADTIAPAESTAVDFVGKCAISNLTDALGINDRFLLIRDLFNGETEAFNAAMDKLNSFDNLDDCMVYIVENYDWNPYCDGAKLLVSLIERRYSHHA